jgi:uncharacterized membrane protein
MIDPILHEWGSLLLRWLHVVTGIAWNGSSFYFMHIDAALQPVPSIPEGKGGGTWEVHGGGFYEVKKYLVAPPELPKELIWHKWESYATWLSGFFLLVWVYYLNAELYLIDPAVRELSPLAAASIGIGALAFGWVVYDGLCRSQLGQSEFRLSLALFGFVVALAFAFQQLFSGRGAFIHTGAVMATIMSANVFMVIVPGQKKIIAALMAGEAPDPALGKRAKQRSTHNNYLTLPVLFLMLSNHYPMTWSTPWGWAVVGLVLIAGALIRVFYNVRHAGGGNPWWTWLVAALALAGAALLSMAGSPLARERLGLAPLAEPPALAGQAPAPASVVEVVTGRCLMCHALEPVWPGIGIAPKGVRFDRPEDIERHKRAIYLQAAASAAMPPANASGMTRDERLLLAKWARER